MIKQSINSIIMKKDIDKLKSFKKRLTFNFMKLLNPPEDNSEEEKYQIKVIDEF